MPATRCESRRCSARGPYARGCMSSDDVEHPASAVAGGMSSEGVAGPPGPSTGTLFWRGCTRACVACGQRRGLVRRRVVLAKECPNCGLRFERIEGHFVGAVGMNTIVSFAQMGLLAIAAFVVFGLDLPLGFLVAALAIELLVFSALFLPVSHTLWTAFDVWFRPLGPTEVDWSKVRR